ncbi:MAG: transcription-repair coupling factor [Lachnospiraceae bacterium]|nr:transcription-repair coupling factor [Lachnospiraceae bacterium]
MSAITLPLSEISEYNEITKDIEKRAGIVEINGCSDSQKQHLAYGLSEKYRNTVIVTYSEQRANDILSDYSYYNKEVKFYPARDLIFYQADIHGNLLPAKRLEALSPLFEKNGRNRADAKGAAIVTTFDALMEELAPFEALLSHILSLSTGDSVNLSDLERELTTLGYGRNYQVEDKGQFSIHGGIVDIFPLTEVNPVRIELWGDEIDSIRSFDVLTQRSLEKLESFQVYPASEIILNEDEIEEGLYKIRTEGEVFEEKLRKEFLTKEAFAVKSAVTEITEHIRNIGIEGCNIESYLNYFYDDTESLLSYFNKEETLILLDEPARLLELGQLIEDEFSDSMKNRLEKGLILPKQAELLITSSEVLSRLDGFATASLNILPLPGGVLKNRISSHYSLITKSVNSYNNSFEALLSDLTRLKKNGYRVLLISQGRTKGKRLAEDLLENGINAFYSENTDHVIQKSEVMITPGSLRQGFEYPLIKFIVISENDIFTAQKKKRRRKSKDGQSIRSFAELTVGDYVIHESHGLGVYEGIEKVTIDNITKDYMKLRYRDDGRLFIPATALDSVQKYAGKKAQVVKLNKLGSSEWNKTKQKVREEIDVIASDLVELYAKRREQSGYVFHPDTVWQTEFEEKFEYEETEDQLLAIEDTKRDMESTKIMDRLICGDVGYGKTEIAIRAAFKAVQDSKQVVYLVPTTILAQQHYNTFVQRMKDYPIRIDMLSRFCTPAEIRKTVEDLKKGAVDIVIGTHRVLSKDVGFKDLGLLIIDEEQRFGVRHKETIKKLRESVDVLTLTATPIPRTLHMSLIGIRDMSLLEEAPQDRVPIQTFVMEYNEELVREAVGRELARGGQVYYVYNRVNTIADMTAALRKLLPDAVIEFAHGQMKEQQLENIMLDFVNGEIDVLVSTTIVETGLDIPNVNTMIIHDSDNMGLSQLYQLRGRVGRSNRTAYAFMLYRKDKILREVAEKRLKAIREFTELGSGYKIAMQDLEIRGAGNILGERQSGHMEAIGYDLYCRMLNEAIQRKKGAEVAESFDTSVELSADAYIPDFYIMNEYQKLDIYKRIAAIDNAEEREEMRAELTDRFGPLPASVINLIDIAYMRLLAKEVFITEIKGEERAIKLSIYENASYIPEKIGPFVGSYKGLLILKTIAKPYFLYSFPRGTLLEGGRLIRYVTELLQSMRELVAVAKTD